MGRTKLKTKKISIGLTINIEINNALEKYLEKTKLSKSEYIEFLIKKDIKNKPE